MRALLCTVIVTFVGYYGRLIAADNPPALQLTGTVPLPGVEGRFDHFAVDTEGHRLFVAAVANNTVEVLDLVAGKRIQAVTGLQKPHGLLYLAGLKRLYIACGGDGMLRTYDGVNLRPIGTITNLSDADNVRFDAAAQRIYVGYGKGALAVTDTNATSILAQIQVPGHPESFQLEPHGTRIFVNIPDVRQITVVDREKCSVTHSWPLTNLLANFPMVLDEPNHRLFIVCRRPARLLAFDSDNGHRVADIEVSGDTDDVFYDVLRRRLYLSCGEGYVDVIAQRNASHYERIERIPTRSGARTAWFSPELDQFYLAVPKDAKHDAEIRIYQAP